MSGSSGGSEVIREFLVNIGYAEHGRKEFTAGLVDVTKGAVALGASIAAAALAVTAAVAVMAKEFDALYFASRRTQASVESIKAFSFAVSQLGGTVEGAQATLENLGRFMRSNPGNEGFIQTLGVQTRQANGQLRDMGRITEDLGAKFKGMSYLQASSYASVLGIDEKTLLALRDGVGEFSDQYRDMAHKAGLDSQQAAKDANVFTTQMKTMGAAVGILKTQVTQAFTRSMAEDMRRFNEWMIHHFTDISRMIVWVADKIELVGQVIARMVLRIGKSIQDVSEWYAKHDKEGQALIRTFGLIAAALGILTIAFNLSPIGKVLLLAFALYGLYEDYKTWKEGGKSLIDWEKWGPEIKAAEDGIERLRKSFLVNLKPAIGELIDSLIGLGVQLGLINKNADMTFGAVLTRAIEHFIIKVDQAIVGLSRLVRLTAALARGDLQEAANVAKEITDGISHNLAPSSDEQIQSFDNANNWGARFRNVFTGADTPGLGVLGRIGELITPSAASPRAPHVVSGQTAEEYQGSISDRSHATPANLAEAQAVYNHWRSKGATRAGALSKVATEQAESGFNPGSRGDAGNLSHGLYQVDQYRRGVILAATGTNMSTATAAQQREAKFREGAQNLDAGAGQAWRVSTSTNDIRTAVDADVRLDERPARQNYTVGERTAIARDWARYIPNDGPAVDRLAGPPGETPAARFNRLLPRARYGDREHLPLPYSLPSHAPTSPLPHTTRGFLNGLTRAAPAALSVPTLGVGPLMGPAANNNNHTSNTTAPVFNTNTTIHVDGGSSDAARQVIDGQRQITTELVRRAQGVVR